MTLTISINPIQPSIFGSIFTPGVVVVVMVVVVVAVVVCVCVGGCVCVCVCVCVVGETFN